MIGYHVTTPHKLTRYERTGAILPPVRFWPSEFTARQWMLHTGRPTLLRILVADSCPMPDHKPARFTESLVRSWSVIP